MNIRHKINTLLHTKRIFWKKLVGSLVFQYFPDKWALKIIYHNIFERPLNLENPRSFTEKLQWLKLYNRNPLYTTLVDKYAVKQWVADRIGEEYIIPTLGAWNSFDEIDFDQLPNKFVLKTTHSGGSSGVVICRDKASFDFAEAKVRLTASLKSNTYLISREWPYKDVPRRIIAEKYMVCQNGELMDYKFFCFNGKVKFFKIDFNRIEGHRANYYNTKKELLPFGEIVCPPDFGKHLYIPQNIEEMIGLAEKISHGNPFMRVDFYSIDNRIYFGEITFFPAGGTGKFTNIEWDYKFGEWLSLPSTK